MNDGLKSALILERTGARMGAERVALLAAIGRTGSISGAAREVGLSYKAAWDGVQAMNNLFASPLVTAAPGGRAGGGAGLTEAGRNVIAAYGAIEEGLAKLMASLEARLDLSAGEVLRGLSLRTSARNMWSCKVTEVTADEVSASVRLALGEGQRLTSVITARSAAEMGLAPGTEVLALVKSNFVMLTREEAPRLSIRNRLTGVVMERIDGDLGAEAVLDLGGGKTLTASITRESAEALALAPGARVTALVKSSHVILALP
ncbi:TOBE domain-containing protein [Rhodobacter lacus]|uniref:TOBE domain-containing protein n=1 Tax=Rhodobacter lacus TaxID=1641972 RepID=A0ABW5AAG2_9RHOB